MYDFVQGHWATRSFAIFDSWFKRALGSFQIWDLEALKNVSADLHILEDVVTANFIQPHHWELQIVQVDNVQLSS